jgi:ELWxxDGT repeat protein
LFIGHGIDLWKSDGTGPGTVLVKRVLDPAYVGAEYSFTSLNGQLYFAVWAYAREFGPVAELWRTDGTEAGTVRIEGIHPSSQGGLAVLNGVLYLGARDGAGTELWKTDGTAAGSMRVKDIWPGSGDSYPLGLTVMGGVLYFNASDGVSGSELWRSDGTEAGTVRVKDLQPGAGVSGPAALTVMGGVLYFTADDGVSGRELWRSDGTEAGTVHVSDLWPGPSSGLALDRRLLALEPEGRLLFTADDGMTGAELWASDGTASGTRQVMDILPGSLSSSPEGLYRAGPLVFFSAIDGDGREPWVLPVERSL